MTRIVPKTLNLAAGSTLIFSPDTEISIAKISCAIKKPYVAPPQSAASTHAIYHLSSIGDEASALELAQFKCTHGNLKACIAGANLLIHRGKNVPLGMKLYDAVIELGEEHGQHAIVIEAMDNQWRMLHHHRFFLDFVDYPHFMESAQATVAYAEAHHVPYSSAEYAIAYDFSLQQPAEALHAYQDHLAHITTTPLVTVDSDFWFNRSYALTFLIASLELKDQPSFAYTTHSGLQKLIQDAHLISSEQIALYHHVSVTNAIRDGAMPCSDIKAYVNSPTAQILSDLIEMPIANTMVDVIFAMSDAYAQCGIQLLESIATSQDPGADEARYELGDFSPHPLINTDLLTLEHFIGNAPTVDSFMQ